MLLRLRRLLAKWRQRRREHRFRCYLESREPLGHAVFLLDDVPWIFRPYVKGSGDIPVGRVTRVLPSGTVEFRLQDPLLLPPIERKEADNATE